MAYMPRYPCFPHFPIVAIRNPKHSRLSEFHMILNSNGIIAY